MILTPGQVDKLIEIVVDFHWMARRYADGRQTYATSMFNEHTRALQAMGIELDPTADGTLWARDGGGRAYDGLSEAEAAENKKETGLQTIALCPKCHTRARLEYADPYGDYYACPCGWDEVIGAPPYTAQNVPDYVDADGLATIMRQILARGKVTLKDFYGENEVQG